MQPLPREVEASYSVIIDEILRASDINTVSAKRIRRGLQERIGQDTTSQKDAITALIMKRFDKFHTEVNGPSPEPPEPIPTVENGAASRSTTPEKAETPVFFLSDLEDSAPPKKHHTPVFFTPSDIEDSAPPTKKAKKSQSTEDSAPPKKRQSTEDSDALFARRLQAQENARVRTTRGGNNKRKAPLAKQKTKKKSSNRVRDEDDSEIDSASEEVKKSPSRKGGFHKPFTLSPALSSLLNETQLSRPQTVKKIWEYIKARDLQDPSDGRQIQCDDALRAVFKQDRVHMFTMNKFIGQHLYAVDEGAGKGEMEESDEE